MSDTLTQRPIAWTVEIQVADHGRWLPNDGQAAAQLIAAINAQRKPTDPKPKVFRDYDGNTCLRVTIDDDDPFILDPGEHLVRLVLPQTSVWNAVTPEQLAELFPEAWPA